MSGKGKVKVTYPDIYFEDTSNFKVRVDRVKLNEHFCDAWKTNNLYCVQSGEIGTYLAFNLHNRPHYQFQVSEREDMKKKADDRNISFFLLNRNHHEIKNNLLHYTNTSQFFSDHVQKFVDRVDVIEIADMLINSDAKDRGVGNITKTVGFSSQNLKFITNPKVPTIKVTGPMQSKVITKQDGYYFMLLTELLRDVYYRNMDFKPEEEDFKRMSEFGARIPMIASGHATHNEFNQPYNMFESMTYALTYLGENEEKLKCHVDIFNERKRGMNLSLCLYFNLYHENSKKYIRIALIGYFRKAVSDYYARLDKRNFLLKNLEMYYLNLENKEVFLIENEIPSEIIEKTYKILRTKLGLHPETIKAIHEEFATNYFCGKTHLVEYLTCEYVRYGLEPYKPSDYEIQPKKRHCKTKDDSSWDEDGEDMEYSAIQKTIVSLCRQSSIQSISSKDFITSVLSSSYAHSNVEHVNINGIVRHIVGYPDNYKTRSRKNQKVMSISSLTLHDGKTIYTGVVAGREEIYVKMTDWIVYDKNFVGFYEKQIGGKTNYVAYYTTMKDALKSVQLLCLCEKAYNMLQTNGLPQWTNQFLKLESKNGLKAIAIYTKMNNDQDLLGLLNLDGQKKSLLVPMDTLDIVDVPWQPFYFTDSGN